MTAVLSGPPRHLRTRDACKKTLSGDTCALIAMSEEEAEMAAVATASHYLEHRGLSSKRRQQDSLITIHNTPKKPRISGTSTPQKDDSISLYFNSDLPDVYCWECHKECVEGALDCGSCPRTFHSDCLPNYKNGEVSSNTTSESWTCPVCSNIREAESDQTRSWAMQLMTNDQFCLALCSALQRMKHPDSEAFHNPVPKMLLPDYYDIIFHPMDLATLEKNVRQKKYNSTDSFLEDVKWILHNSVIYNGASSKYTSDAKLIIKICKHEMSEIELCPDCYLNSCYRREHWFTEPCTYPHCLVWAKLKGFPYWPAKALRISANNNVDVRFFGAHDRAWIPMSQLFLISEDHPNAVKNIRKHGFDTANEELKMHVNKLGKIPSIHFRYAPFKTEFKSEYISHCEILFGSEVQRDERRNVSIRSLLPASDVYFVQANDSASSIREGFSLQVRINRSTSSCSSTTANNEEESGVVSSSIVRSTSADISIDDVQLTSSDRPQPKARKQITRPTITNNCRRDADECAASVPSTKPSQAMFDDCSSVFDKLQVSSAKFASPPSTSAASDASSRRAESVGVRSIKDATPPLSLANQTASDAATANQSGARSASLPLITTSAALLSLSKPVQSTTGSSFEPTTHTATTASASEMPIPPQPSSLVKKRSIQFALSRMSGSASMAAKTAAATTAKALSLGSSAVSVASMSASLRPSTLTLNSKQNARKMAASIALRHPPPPNVTLLPKTSAPLKPSAPTATTRSLSSFLASETRNRLAEKYANQVASILKRSFVSLIEDVIRESNSKSSDTNHFAVPGERETHKNLDHSESALQEMKWFYEEAMRALKSTTKTSIQEMQQAADLKHNADMEQLRKKFEEEKSLAVKETKQKQWCACCGKEAVFYCCWNTSYCDYPCQQQHWPTHQTTCAQIRPPATNDFPPNNYSLVPQHVSAVGPQHLNIVQPAGGPAPNMLPVYAAAGYYKTVALDLNPPTVAASGQQFLAIHPPRQSSALLQQQQRPAATYVTSAPGPLRKM